MSVEVDPDVETLREIAAWIQIPAPPEEASAAAYAKKLHAIADRIIRLALSPEAAKPGDSLAPDGAAVRTPPKCPLGKCDGLGHVAERDPKYAGWSCCECPAGQALYPHLRKPGTRTAERSDAAPRVPAKPAEAATCELDCGDTILRFTRERCAERKWFGAYRPDYEAMILFCTEACRDVGRPLHPATEQAATCGTCGGTGNPYWDRSVYWDHPEKGCPDCGGTGRR